MNSFEKASEVENIAIPIIFSYIKHISLNEQAVTTSTGKHSRSIQAKMGDFFMNAKESKNHVEGQLISIELKAELENLYGNIFLETWSNCKREFQKRGWMEKLECDYLWYYFLKSDELISMNFSELWKWFFEEGNGRIYPEKTQYKYDQLNITKGVCVPIDVLMPMEWVKIINPKKIISNLNHISSNNRLINQ